jgi:MarR family transcriptional regulator, organic hydroperoxide resistance regulator
MKSELNAGSINQLVLQFLRQHFLRTHMLFEEIGVFRGQPPLLHKLWDNEGSTQSELAESLHMAPATITKMLQRMQQSGLVERRPDPADQRVSRVFLTDAARDLKEVIQAREQQVGQEMLDGFTREEREQLAGFLARMRENLMRANHDAPLI